MGKKSKVESDESRLKEEPCYSHLQPLRSDCSLLS